MCVCVTYLLRRRLAQLDVTPQHVERGQRHVGRDDTRSRRLHRNHGVPGQAEVCHDSFDVLFRVERQHGEIIAALVCHVRRQFDLHVPLCGLADTGKEPVLFDLGKADVVA